MITIPLAIRHRSQREHATVAWLLPGGDPASWLEEMIDWGVSLDTLRLFPLPTSRADRTVAGVLVVRRPSEPVDCHTTASEGWRTSSVKPTVIQYGVVAERLFLPVDAILQPQIDDRELANLFSPDIVAYVFHPTIGLLGFDEASVLRVRDLLNLPSTAASNWDAARPGLKINERLVSIELADPPTLESIFQEAKEDIGSQSSSISQLPPIPNEPSNGPISKMGRGAMSGVAKAMLWLTSMAPQNASKPTWVNSLQDWAASKLAGVGQAIDSIRNKEIRRLLDLLQNNPDEGLQYAFPLDGAAHRGTASPTNYLFRRPVNFSLSGLGGGLAGDYWQIERQYYERLRQSYRELAAREVNLGRYRRAAYIYAELLSDLNAAATTLKDGGHHREAAVLYRDRLNRPLEAAKCLEEGGLVGEAIALFEELKEYERVGDLYRRIEQPEEALDAYRLAADAHATSDDLLSAARILEDKMKMPDRALEALEAGWPSSSQAGGCLRSLIELVARLGRHDLAQNCMRMLRDERYNAKQTQLAAATMANTANSYPHEEVRALAADSCRVVVGRSLRTADVSQQRQLLQSIEQLASEDRLLQRDCSRFGRQTVEPKRRPVVAPRTQRYAEPTLFAEFALSKRVQWQTVVAANELFYAAGYEGNSLSLVRGEWSGNTQSPAKPWQVRLVPGLSESGILLAPPVGDLGALWVYSRSMEDAPTWVFSPTDQFPKRGSAVALPVDGEGILAITRGPLGVGWIFSLLRDGPCLSAYSPDGVLIRSHPLSSIEFREWDWLRRVMLHASHDAIYVANGVGLLRTGKSGEHSTDFFAAPIKSLIGTSPHTRTRLAIAFQQSGYVLWPNAVDDIDTQAFGQDLSDFEMCFTKGGALVALSATTGEIYSTHDGKVELIAKMNGSGERPLAVVPTSHVKQFAVFMRSGAVRVYRLP
ncbi:MAG: hypothetical protein KDB05_04750 [Planctomycetales bacterium]|nr:hypothetical protein [Planctomycetales bacterium]